jgi:hypothetical protein
MMLYQLIIVHAQLNILKMIYENSTSTAKFDNSKDKQREKLIEMMRKDNELGLYGTNYIGHTDAAANRVFESGSQRDNDTNKPLPSHLDAYVRLRYGYLLRMGANHYEKGNWKKGQPTETAIESLHRHLAKFEINLENGVEQDEDHLSAIIFNVQLIMKNEQKEGISVDNYYKK